MLTTKSDIDQLIPQRAPMIMVDGLVDCSELQTTSAFRLSPENIFCAHGYFQEAGIIENMAQTAALRSGYLARQQGVSPRRGFIGALKRIKIHALPMDTDLLQTTIVVEHELLNAMVIRGEVYVDHSLMAEGEMTIFLLETEEMPTTDKPELKNEAAN